MKILLLSTLLLTALSGGDRERGMQLYKDGRFPEAQAAFQSALADNPESAELQWNLALSAWRAGDLTTAEVAAEKYAALSKDAKDELHRGLLGAVRFAEAEALELAADQALAASQQPPMAAGPPDPDAEPVAPLPLLEKALQKAVQAKNHFVRGARAKATPELLRNTERSLRKIDELQQRIEELRKQQEQQQQEGDQNQDDKQPEDGSKDDDKKDGDKKKSDKSDGDQKEDDKKKGEQNKSDEKTGDQKPGDEKPGDEKPGDKKGESKPDPSEQPGESPEPKEGEGESAPETPEPKPGESGESQPEPKPEPKPESSEGESQPSSEAQPDVPEPGKEQQQAGEEQLPQPPEPKPGEQRSDAPGEGGEGHELSPEQLQRLLERQKQLDEQFKLMKARRSTRRRSVERDW